jgi:tetratricopeptide (TPR) repeat protein
VSADPGQADYRPAISAFKDQKYREAQQLLDALLEKHPNSATLRVWRGDAALFDKAADYKQAAETALRYYEAAERLHDRGCTLPESEHYYMRFDAALASLRKGDAAAAIRQLDIAKQKWADSAELHYNLARAHCMKNELGACYENFAKALEIAHTLKRPRFLRSHYSVDDWLRRSKTQSEFPALRRDPRYAPLVKKMTP